MRVVRTGESAIDGVAGAGTGVGVLRPKRVGGSGAAGDECADSYAGSPNAANVLLRVGRGGKPGAFTALEEVALNDVFGAEEMMGVGGGTVSDSGGFGTRSASRINRKSRPNS